MLMLIPTLLILLSARDVLAFQDTFDPGKQAAKAARKSKKKARQKQIKQLNIPPASLPEELQKLIDGEECTTEKYHAMRNTLQQLFKPRELKRNPDIVDRIAATLRNVEQVEVGPHHLYKHQRQPLQSLKLVFDCEYARMCPINEIAKHPASECFPGQVSKSAERKRARLEINLGSSGYISTGYYAPPGEIITVSLPPELLDYKANLVIGLHKTRLDLAKHKALRRAPRIDRTFPIKKHQMQVASAFGGLIYLNLRNTDQNSTPTFKPAILELEGAVKAPRYILGETSDQEWNGLIRYYPAPYAELACNQLIITLPSEPIRNLESPGNIMKTWENLLTAAAELAGIQQPRPYPIRILIDAHVNFGAAYAGYPIVGPYRWLNTILKGRANWGQVHEIGHVHQQRAWTFFGCGEVTANLFSLYLHEKIYNDTSRRSNASQISETEAAWFAQPKAERNWNGRGHQGKLTCYMQIINAFGWEPLKKVFHSYRPELDHWNNHRKVTERERASEFVLRLSKATQKNLYPYFDEWGLPMDPLIQLKLTDLPIWMPNNLENSAPAQPSQNIPAP